MLLATALALLITGCAQQTFTVQNKPAAVAPRNHHPSFLRFWNWAEENCRCSQNLLAALKMLLKQGNPANIRKWIARFYYFRHLLRGSACIAHNNCMSCPSIWATLSALLDVYFWVPSSCFCIVISLSLRVK